MATKAQDARFEALRAMNDKYLPADNKYTPRDMTGVEEILIDVLNLRAMGKTERWKNACATLYSMVKNAKDENELRWAIIEGTNHANYANL